MRSVLRGVTVIAEERIDCADLPSGLFVFSDSEAIPPGLYVMLTTGCGRPHWTRTRDGCHVFRTFMNRAAPLWNRLSGPIHVLVPQHSYVERGELLMLR